MLRTYTIANIREDISVLKERLEDEKAITARFESQFKNWENVEIRFSEYLRTQKRIALIEECITASESFVSHLERLHNREIQI